MRLTMVIESTQDDTLIPRLIPMLTEMPLEEILKQPFVADLLEPRLPLTRLLRVQEPGRRPAPFAAPA